MRTIGGTNGGMGIDQTLYWYSTDGPASHSTSRFDDRLILPLFDVLEEKYNLIVLVYLSSTIDSLRATINQLSAPGQVTSSVEST